jgi:hypothetical protein
MPGALRSLASVATEVSVWAHRRPRAARALARRRRPDIDGRAYMVSQLTQLPRVLPLQCATRSISKKPGRASSQSVKVRTGISWRSRWLSHVRVAPAAGELRDRQSLWQITACDAACFQGVASLLPELSAAATTTFMRQILVSLYRRAPWPLQRVLTDGRSEFKAAFAEACRALSIVVKPIARAPEHGDEPAVIKPFHPAALQRESTTPVVDKLRAPYCDDRSTQGEDPKVSLWIITVSWLTGREVACDSLGTEA